MKTIKLLCKNRDKIDTSIPSYVDKTKVPFTVGDWYEFEAIMITHTETKKECLKYYNNTFRISLIDDIIYHSLNFYVWDYFYTQQEMRQLKLIEILDEDKIIV
jgi:tagatose-1,6-bisphosphate aldolase non-catalytic subunit AgaZ/GatZ